MNVCVLTVCEHFCRTGAQSAEPALCCHCQVYAHGNGFVCRWRPVYTVTVMDTDFLETSVWCPCLHSFLSFFSSLLPTPLHPVKLPPVLPSLWAPAPALSPSESLPQSAVTFVPLSNRSGCCCCLLASLILNIIIYFSIVHTALYVFVSWLSQIANSLKSGWSCTTF